MVPKSYQWVIIYTAVVTTVTQIVHMAADDI